MEKCAGIIIKNKCLLVVRKRGTNVYISPGGKIENGETQMQCLYREIYEEVGAAVMSAAYFDTYKRPAEFDDAIITIHAWIVSLDREPSANSEIEEICWITGSCNLLIGSVLRECIVPNLIRRELINA